MSMSVFRKKSKSRKHGSLFQDDFAPTDGDSPATTADTNYLNVPIQSLTQLPLMKWEDKCQVWKLEPTGEHAPKTWNQAGVPLLWQECKTEDLWCALLKNHSVQQVVDLTCGSGRLACACLASGIKYWGLAEGPVHQAWVGNILDQRSLRLITVEGHALWQQSLADLIKSHFSEINEGDDEEQQVDNQQDDEEQGEDGAADNLDE